MELLIHYTPGDVIVIPNLTVSVDYMVYKTGLWFEGNKLDFVTLSVAACA